MVATNDKPTERYRPSDYTDFAHAGPGTLAGDYLRHFWQPVYRAAELPPGHAKPVRIMNEDFTLYRGEDGQPHVVAARCAHRGTQLSTGWVEGDCIRCFYHGWKYDGSGQCVEMPAEEASFPPKVRIKGYPCQEYIGLIFAYLGDREPPPLPRHGVFEGDGVLETEVYYRPCNYFQNIENGPDEVHLAFVHHDTHGLPVVPRVEVEETEYGLVQYGYRPGQPVRVTHIEMPNILRIKIPPPAEAPDSAWRDYVSWRVPVDDTMHVTFVTRLVHVTGEAAAEYRRRCEESPLDVPSVDEMTERVLRGELRVHDLVDYPYLLSVQDTVAQVGQGVMADREHERLGRSDVGVILVRKLWERELRALAEGRPLQSWVYPERLETTSGV
ncbi:MAG TPA: Rieske 2Fe-2S domain-containing protein [Chloroflexota bacterium]|jgi:5,5'-dehydrodivanillate O-demethylase